MTAPAVLTVERLDWWERRIRPAVPVLNSTVEVDTREFSALLTMARASLDLGRADAWIPVADLPDSDVEVALINARVGWQTIAFGLTTRDMFVRWYESLSKEQRIDVWYECNAMTREEVEAQIEAGRKSEAALAQAEAEREAMLDQISKLKYAADNYSRGVGLWSSIEHHLRKLAAPIVAVNPSPTRSARAEARSDREGER